MINDKVKEKNVMKTARAKGLFGCLCGLVVFFVLFFVVSAQQVQAADYPFYPVYYITGTVTVDAPEDYNVVFYKDIVTAEVKVSLSGTYEMNVNAIDPPSGPIATNLDNAFTIALIKRAGGSVASSESINLSGKGYDIVNFDIAFASKDPIIMYISRAENRKDLIINWKLNKDLPADTKIDMYMLVGDGSGSYADAGDSWTKIISNEVLIASADEFGLDAANKKITFKNQDGAGSPEVYFKGVLAYNDKAKTLKEAVAVGKFNIDIYTAKKYNFVSTPFYLYDLSDNLITDPEKIFSNKIAKKDMRVYAFDNSNSEKAYKLISYSGGWKGDVADAKVYPGFSYWIYNTFGDMSITVIGKHYDEKQRKGKGKKSTLESGGAKGAYNVFALPNSQRKELKNLLTAKDGVRVYVFDNKEGAYSLFSYDPGTKDWTGNTSIKPTLGMWYYNKSDTQLDWIKE